MNVKPLLSGADLVREKLSGPREIPSMGLKEFRPSNSWLEKRQIRGCLDELYGLLSAERIEKISNLSKADWDPNVHKAKVTKKVGKHWETFGHYEQNSDWLYPEEALFLLETSSLELCYGGIPMSIEQSYSLLIGKSCSLEEYRVYSYLSRTGYRIIRHKKPKNDEIKESADKIIEIEDNGVNSVESSTDNTTEKEPENEIEIIEDLPRNNIECVTINDSSDSDDDVIYVTTGKTPVWYSTKTKFLTPLNSDEKESRASNYADLKRMTRFHILNCLPNVKSGLSRITAPDKRLLPNNIAPKHSSYGINLRNRDVEDSLRMLNGNPSPFMPRRARPLLSTPVPFPRQRYGGQMIQMQAMAFQMMQTASNIMAAYNNPVPVIPPQFNYRNTFRRRGFRRRGRQRYMSNGNQRPSCSNETISLDSDDEKPIKRQGSSNIDVSINKKTKIYNLSSSDDDDCSFVKNDSKPSSADQVCLEMLKDFKSEVTRLNSEVEELIKNSVKNESNYVQTAKDENMDVEPILPDSTEQIQPNQTSPKPQIDDASEIVASDSEKNLEMETDETDANPPMLEESSKNDDIIILPDQEMENFLENELLQEDEANVTIETASPVTAESQESILISETPEPIVSEDSKLGGETVFEEIQKIYTDLPIKPKDMEDQAPISWAELKRQSLINPQNSRDMKVVLKTLQIFQPITSQIVTKVLKVSYDVFLPTDHYKKSAYRSPKFRIIVMQPHDALPTKSEMDQLSQFYTDNVNFVYAIVTNESISFFLYDSVDLPVIQT